MECFRLFAEDKLGREIYGGSHVGKTASYDVERCFEWILERIRDEGIGVVTLSHTILDLAVTGFS